MRLKSFVMESNWVYLVALLFCCFIMAVIDYFLGEQAEFLNAWSALVNLLRLPFEVPTSLIMERFGVIGELLVVLLVNGLLGFILVKIVRWGIGR